MTLRARLGLGLALVAVVLVVGATLVSRATRSYLIGQVDDDLRRATVGVARFDVALADAVVRQEPPVAAPSFGVVGGGPAAGGTPGRLSNLFVGIVTEDAADTVFAPNLTDGTPPVPDLAAIALAEHTDGEPFTIGAVDGHTRFRVLITATDTAGTYFAVGLPIDDAEDTVRGLRSVEVAVTVTVVAVLGLVAWWVQALGIRPLRQMTATATAIADGDLSHRAPVGDPRTEAGELGVALNRMLGQIESSFEARDATEDRLRRFAADASHELRTPLATISGYAELYRLGGLTDPGQLDDAMRRTESETVRIRALVEDLLTLARLDQHRPLRRDPVDLAALVADAALDAGVTSTDHVIRLDIVDPADAVVTGDEHALRQVVANLVTNGLVHTPPGTTITISVQRSGPEVRIVVADDGPGMDEQDVQRAFERFHRADTSRSRDHGGSGLGLAIVQSMVEAHGGRARMESRPGAGTTVTVELPAATIGTDSQRTPIDV